MNRRAFVSSLMLSVGFAGLTFGQAAGRSAEAILADYDGVVMPKLDRTKTSDPAYTTEFRKQLIETYAKKADFAKELMVAAPESPRLVEVMTMRWQFLMQTTPATAVPEVDGVLATGKPESLVKISREIKAQQLIGVADKKTGAEKTEVLQKVISDFAETSGAAQAKGLIRQADAMGKVFDLKFTDAITGKEISTETLKGKVVVLDFWATWCGPCIAEMPKMKALYAEYKEKGVEFVGVSLDQPEARGGLKSLKDYVAKNEIGWPQYYQGNYWQSEFSASWGVSAIPCVFVLDHEGKLYSTEARGKLATMIPELLAKRDAGPSGVH